MDALSLSHARSHKEVDVHQGWEKEGEQSHKFYHANKHLRLADGHPS